VVDGVESRTGVWLRYLRAWLPPLVTMATILSLSSMRGSPIPTLSFPYADKLAHATIYAVYGALLLRALWLSSPRLAGVIVVVPVVLYVAGFGGIDEFYQGFVPHRTPEWLDWVADMSGGLVGALIMWRFRHWRGRTVPPPQP